MYVNINKARTTLMKYLVDDPLKPQYNGISAYEVAYKILEAGLECPIDYSTGKIQEEGELISWKK